MKADQAERPLKIAILLDKFLPSRGGERYFSFLARELAERGHDVHVFATEVEDGGDLPYRVHLVPLWRYPRWLRILTFWRSSARLLRKEKFDIVHGVAQSPAVNVLNPHGGVEKAYLRQEFTSIIGARVAPSTGEAIDPQASIAGTVRPQRGRHPASPSMLAVLAPRRREAGGVTLWEFTTSRAYYVYKLLKRYLSIRHYLEVGLQQRLYRGDGLRKVIAISTMIKRDIREYYGFPEDRIAVVFNSVDLDRFHPRNRELYRQRMRTELGVREETVVLLFAGNNFRLKGLETLLRALAVLKRESPNRDFRLLVAGRGRPSRYRGLSRRLGIWRMVSFLGPVEGMEQYYGVSDIYVHPTFYDSCSLTVLEALASGLPVVTTRFNGASDAIVSEDGGRIIRDPGDPSELATAIGAFVDEEKRVVARSVARSWMERYSPQRNVEETLDVYYEVAKSAQPSERDS